VSRRASSHRGVTSGVSGWSGQARPYSWARGRSCFRSPTGATCTQWQFASQASCRGFDPHHPLQY